MYKTQMEAARKGIFTEQMKHVSIKEKIDKNHLLQGMSKGEIIIPANKNHISLEPAGIGTGLRTKINVNLGISQDCRNCELELAKVRYALDLKADAIMDLSCYGKTRDFRKQIIHMSPAMVGTVPVYDTIGYFNKTIEDLTVDDFFKVIRIHAEDGVDFITIHAGMTQKTNTIIRQNKRLTSIVSRGGSLLFNWMVLNDAENPFLEHYDRLLDICREYDVTLSLGDGCRPGSIHDATDAAQISELIELGELTQRAWDQDIQVMIEGPGHMALDEIAGNVMLEKKLCHNAPFYVLGPLVTDVAPGYDHITSAIGSAIAASYGADFLCYVTPAEHLKLPDISDMKEGIMAARIAAHAADVAKKIPGSRDWDDRMSKARADLDWEKMFELSLDPEKAESYRLSSLPEHDDSCTMCGNLCAVRNMKRIQKGNSPGLN